MGWLSQTKPDVVMVHLGTNDVWSNQSPSAILGAFDTLVKQMRASKATMKILVSSVLPPRRWRAESRKQFALTTTKKYLGRTNHPDEAVKLR